MTWLLGRLPAGQRACVASPAWSPAFRYADLLTTTRANHTALLESDPSTDPTHETEDDQRTLARLNNAVPCVVALFFRSRS
jgi:hypothetical protein